MTKQKNPKPKLTPRQLAKLLLVNVTDTIIEQELGLVPGQTAYLLGGDAIRRAIITAYEAGRYAESFAEQAQRKLRDW